MEDFCWLPTILSWRLGDQCALNEWMPSLVHLACRKASAVLGILVKPPWTEFQEGSGPTELGPSQSVSEGFCGLRKKSSRKCDILKWFGPLLRVPYEAHVRSGEEKTLWALSSKIWRVVFYFKGRLEAGHGGWRTFRQSGLWPEVKEQQLGASSAVCWEAEGAPSELRPVPASATWQQRASGGDVGTGMTRSALPPAQSFQTGVCSGSQSTLTAMTAP